MNTNKDYIYRKIGGESVLVPTGKATQKFNGMISLSETAAFIFKHINQSDSLEDIVQALLEEYEVDENTARRDVTGMMKAFWEHGIVENVPEFE